LLYIARSNEYIPDPENEDKLSLSAGDIVEPGAGALYASGLIRCPAWSGLDP